MGQWGDSTQTQKQNKGGNSFNRPIKLDIR